MITMEQAIELNKQSGSSWFSEGNMKFFGTVIESELMEGDIFITSEYTGFDTEERAYTVRQFKDGYSDVKDIGRFNQFHTLEEAMKVAHEYKAYSVVLGG